MPYNTFNNFPYTNLHDLNLDWLLEKMTEIDNRTSEEGIANAIRSMYNNGDFSGLLAQLNKMCVVFDTVTDMTAAMLDEGTIAVTQGYHSPGIGGCLYFITSNYEGYSVACDNDLQAVPLLTSVDVLQLGAYADDTHDDTDAIQAAVDYFPACFVPEGTYKITQTVTISGGVELRGAGINSTILNYTGSGNMFQITALYTERPVISDMRIMGDAATFVNCDAGVWGGSVRLEHLRINGFNSLAMRFASAFEVICNDLILRSSGKILLTTYSGTATTTNFCNSFHFNDCYFNRLSNDSRTSVIFELFNTRQILFTNCQLEHADLAFHMTGTAANTVLESCWLEDLTALYSFDIGIDVATSTPTINHPRMVQVSSFNANPDTVDWSPNLPLAFIRNPNGRTFVDLRDGTEKVFHQLQTYSTGDDIHRYWDVYKVSSKEIVLNRPVNSFYVQSDTDSIRLNTGEITGYNAINALFDIYVTFQYGTDTSALFNIHHLKAVRHYGTVIVESNEVIHTGSSGKTETVSCSNTGVVQGSTDVTPTKIFLHAIYNILQ